MMDGHPIPAYRCNRCSTTYYKEAEGGMQGLVEDALIGQNVVHDLDLASNGAFAKLNTEAVILLRGKLQQIMLQEKLEKDNATYH